MGKSPYIPFYFSNWLGGTAMLSASERGIYITLIAMMYETEQPISMDRRRLARLCGAPVKQLNEAIETLLNMPNKLVMRDGGLWQERVSREIDKRSHLREVNSQNAASRWEKPVKKQRARDATASKSHCETDAYQNQNHNHNHSNISPNGDMSFEAVEIYHSECPSLPKVQKLTAKRKAALTARLRDCGGLDGWREVCRRAEASPFLRGDNDRGFKAGFDFLITESTFVKLIEGKYDDRAGNQIRNHTTDKHQSAADVRTNAWLEAIAEREGDSFDGYPVEPASQIGYSGDSGLRGGGDETGWGEGGGDLDRGANGPLLDENAHAGGNARLRERLD